MLHKDDTVRGAAASHLKLVPDTSGVFQLKVRFLLSINIHVLICFIVLEFLDRCVNNFSHFMINVSKVNWNLKNTILWFLSRFETIYHMYQASEHASQPHNLRYFGK